MIGLIVVTVVALVIRVYLRRVAEQRAAHDARLSALAQVHLAALRKKKAADAAAAKKASAGVVETPPSAAPLREERDCPFCAEPILKKAKVCKHCARDVEPLV